jgi:hypothetical protein
VLAFYTFQHWRSFFQVKNGKFYARAQRRSPAACGASQLHLLLLGFPSALGNYSFGQLAPTTTAWMCWLRFYVHGRVSLSPVLFTQSPSASSTPCGQLERCASDLRRGLQDTRWLCPFRVCAQLPQSLHRLPILHGEAYPVCFLRSPNRIKF